MSPMISATWRCPRTWPCCARLRPGRSPMAADASVIAAGLELKNPVIAGSGEATMTREGILAALEAGAAAVVAKSINESDAAKRQLATAEYVLLDADWRGLPWGSAPRSA